jgi:RNA polymerase sigma-70 factor (ECF subfamily)
MLPPVSVEQAIERTVREEWGRILASLVATLNNFQLAEDCLQDAVLSAMSHWSRNGLPRAPAAWLITVARRKALDRLRRDQNFKSKQADIAYLIELENQDLEHDGDDMIPDKRLEMIFTCCHPALETKSRVALTLRTLGGLTTQEIASAFLDKPEAMQQRITRAKKKIAATGIPYKVPEPQDLPERTAAVASVLYLIFNEGYAASNGKDLVRADLSAEAIRLTRIVNALMPDNCEVAGLLALMLLHDSRRAARTDPDGEMIALEHQNRARWKQDNILEGVAILERVLPLDALGPYQLQAAISAVHAQSSSWAETDWHEISALYDLLYALQPTPVVRVNQAVALSYAVSVPHALKILNEIEHRAELETYPHFHAAKADLLARNGQKTEAKAHYTRAIELTDNRTEQQFLKTAMDRLWAGRA